MIVAGIDPSLTGCAVALFNVENECQSVQTYSSNPADGLSARFQRFDGLCIKVLDQLLTSSLCCIEGYSFASKGGKAFDRVEFGALLRWRLMSRGVKLIEVPPTTLKLFAAGKGNADKTAMALAIYKRWGYEFPDDNQVDAYALARLAACLGGFAQAENDAQRRAIDSLTKPKAPKKRKSA